MIESMADIVAGKSYACKFRVETMLDINEDPAPNLNQAALAGLGVYEGFGVVLQRDTTQEVVLIKCEDRTITNRGERPRWHVINT